MRDVRMKGFAERADVEDVERFLAEHTRALDREAVPIDACAGRVLARDVAAEVDVPGFARAAMDGYAVRGEETFGASTYDPISLRVVGQALPGAPFPGRVGAGCAVRVMTGAPVPEGADAVAMAEVCEQRGDSVAITEPVAPHKHVGAVGEDVRKGETLLRAGRVLRAQDAGLLAAIGVAAPPCVRRPRVRLVITGDELLPPGSRPTGARIVDSNSVMLAALAARDGAVVLPHEIVPDRPDAIRAALGAGGADAVVVSGGSSVGQEDHAPRLVAELGTLDYHGVSMRPSSPAGVGRIGACTVFLLPGNPVSCLCAYEFFAGPTLRALGGRSRAWPHRRVSLPLARKISSAVGRTDYVRVAIEAGRVVPIATSGASILSSTVRADGCVIVPRALEGMPEGALVEVRLYDEHRDE
ncbi:MAG: molybdopterin molybdotransferase MoeA [Deltaproteobacteria bacterium]|nr:MAG: molybdopterin molybdotransferase MoeA [Deltaproteobacteria bacterium]